MTEVPDSAWLECIIPQEIQDYLDDYFVQYRDEMMKVAQRFGPEDGEELNPEDISGIGYRIIKIDQKEFRRITEELSDEESLELARAYLGTIVLEEVFSD